MGEVSAQACLSSNWGLVQQVHFLHILSATRQHGATGAPASTGMNCVVQRVMLKTIYLGQYKQARIHKGLNTVSRKCLFKQNYCFFI